jgi:plasmid stability protein
LIARWRIHLYFVNASHLTVRNLPQELAVALEREKAAAGHINDQTVIDLLRQGLGVTGTRSSGVARLASTWTEAEHEEFLSAIRSFEEIDRNFWK